MSTSVNDESARAAHDFLLELRHLVSPRVPTVPRACSLEQLLEARRLLAIDDSDPGHLRSAAGRIADKFRYGAGLEDALYPMLFELDRQIVERVATLTPAQVHSAGLVRSADFGDALSHIAAPTMNGTDRVLVVGFLDGLPAQHPLRSALSPDELFRFENSTVGVKLCLILGPYASVLVGKAMPRPFYTLESSLRVTANLRHQQRTQETLRNRQQAERDAAEERARLATEDPREARLRQLTQRVEELERAAQSR